MIKRTLKIFIILLLSFCIVFPFAHISNTMMFADSADEIEREPSDEDELTVVINPTDDLPDSEDNGLQDDVINNEDDVDQDNVANVWLIVGISVGAVAVVSLVATIIVKKRRSF